MEHGEGTLLRTWPGRILVIFAILRFGLIFVALGNPTGGILIDSEIYLELSSDLLQGGEYTNPYWPPGYPGFLALTQSLLGDRLAIVAFLQIGLSLLISILLYWILRNHGYPESGFVAGGLSLISPAMTLWSLTIMSEVLFTALLATALLAVTLGLKRQSVRFFLLAGLTLGLAALVRPIGLVLVPLWSLTLLFSTGAWKIRKRFAWCSLLLVIGLLPALGWSVRNQIVLGQFSFSGIASRTFLSFNIANVLADAQGITRDEAATMIALAEDPVGYAFDIVRQEPTLFLSQQLQGVARTIFGVEAGPWAKALGTGTGSGFGMLSALVNLDVKLVIERLLDLWRDPQGSFVLVLIGYALIHSLGIYSFALIGFFRSRRLDPSVFPLVLICIGSTLYLILSPGAAGQGRFRIPVEPFLCLLAGLGSLVFLSPPIKVPGRPDQEVGEQTRS